MEAAAAALQASAFGQWAAGGVYPVANIVHLLGLVMLVGGIGIVDLRLMGAFRALPVEALSRYLTPLALGGLVLMVPSGFTMFAADAKSLIGSPVFGWKLLAIGAALLNAVLFRWLWRQSRVLPALSLALWLTAAALGRMIAYS